MKMNKKLVVPCAVNLIVCVLCLFLIKFTIDIKNTFDRAANQVLEEWEDNSQQYLDTFSEKILFDINSQKVNLYNSEEFNNYVKKNVEYINMNKRFDDYYIIDQGFSIKSISLNNAIKIFKINGINLNKPNTDILRLKLLELSQNKSDINKIISDIDILSKKMYENDCSLNCDSVKKIFIDILFEKNNVIEGTNKLKDVSQFINKKYVNNIHNKKWISVVTIPGGKLGFLNEPNYINNSENKIYKKITIVVISNSSNKLNILQKNHTLILWIIRTLIFIMVSISAVSIIKIIKIFKKQIFDA